MNLIKNLFPLPEVSQPRVWQVHVFAGMGVLLSFLRGARHGSMLALVVTTVLGLLWLFRRDLLSRLLSFLIQTSLIMIQSVSLVLLTLTYFTVILVMHFWLLARRYDPLQRQWTSDASYLEAPEKLVEDSFLRPF